jgi:hypothetical protein
MAAALSLAVIGRAMADGAQRPCAYTVVTVPAPVCPFWGPRAPDPPGMNNLGNWVGSIRDCSTGWDRPIRWTPQTGIAPLPLPPGTSVGWASDVNDAGLAVGHCDHRAYAWSADGAFELLQVTTPGSSCTAEAVNNLGAVVGWKYDANSPGVMMSFVWSAGASTDINPTHYGLNRVEAKDISDSGYVCGWVDGDWMGRGFRWRDGVLEVLEPLPGALGSTAHAINDAGVAEGSSHFFQEDGETHSHYLPTMWIGTQAIPLPLLPGYTSGYTRDINSAGVVIGRVGDPSQPGLPSFANVVWVNGEPIAYKPLIQHGTPNGAGLGTGYALNEHGQILSAGLVSPPGGGGVWILTPHGVVADLTNDCTVDGADLAVLLEAWGPRRAGHPADLDGDGKVGGADLGLLLARWTI